MKDVIEATNPEFPAAQLKLIHSGKILKDESSLQEYNIKEDEFLVCMVMKVSRRLFSRWRSNPGQIEHTQSAGTVCTPEEFAVWACGAMRTLSTDIGTDHLLLSRQAVHRAVRSLPTLTYRHAATEILFFTCIMFSFAPVSPSQSPQLRSQPRP